MKLILFPIIGLSLWLNSCVPTEYYNVRVYQRTQKKQVVTPSDNPRDFIPKERF